MKESIIFKQFIGYPIGYKDIFYNDLLNGDKVQLYYNIFDSNLSNKIRDIGYAIIKYDKTLDLFYLKLLQSLVIGNKVYTMKDNIYLYDEKKLCPKSTSNTIYSRRYLEFVEHDENNTYTTCSGIYNSLCEDDLYKYLKKLINSKILSLPPKNKDDEISSKLRKMIEETKNEKNDNDLGIQILGKL